MQSGKQNKLDLYKRDILRDYALASAELTAQFNRFDKSGAISYSIIRGILGEIHSKGLLWQLKDSAHHLFDSRADTSPAGQQLDWAIGFLFHECIIILEASYQLQKYYPAAQNFIRQNSGNAAQNGLRRLAAESQDSLARTIGRIRRLLEGINQLMAAYLAGDSHNLPLARLFYDREDLLRPVFGQSYEALLAAVFGEEQERMPLLAAWSLFESGHLARAGRAAQKALAQKPHCAEAAELLDKIARLRQ